MITNKDINGISFSIPEAGDSSWGDYTTALLEALIDSSIFTKSGSSKSLQADLDLGTVYGVTSKFFEGASFESTSSNPADGGVIRLANGDKISWRNYANGGNIEVTISGVDNRLTVAGVNIPTASSTDVLSNKSLEDATTKIVDSDDNSKALNFELGGATASRTMTIASSQTDNRTLTLPDATDTLVGKATTDTLTNKSFDANGTGNSITNLEVADFAANVVDTDGSFAANSDTRIPSQKAAKTYADTKLATAAFTDAAVTSKLLTGFAAAAGTVAATDTILQGFNKLAGNDAASSAIVDDMDEPHGLVGTPTISYLGSRQIRIAHPFSYYYKGAKFNSVANVDVTVTNSTDVYYLAFTDAAGTASAVASSSLDIPNQVLYAAFYWNASTSDYIFMDERHGITMDSSTHAYLHLTRGAAYRDGGAISGYVLSSDTLADVQVALDQTRFYDEDIAISQAARLEGDNWDKWYRTGSTGEWVKDGVDTIPAFHTTNVPKINTYSAPNWSLTSVTNNYYFNTYVFALNSAESSNRYIVIPGQSQSSTLAGAQTLSIANLSLGSLPAQEIIPLYKLTWQYKTAYTGNNARVRLEAVEDLRRSVSPAVSVGVSTNHNSLAGRSDADAHPASAITNTPAGNIAATTVQEALNELDTEKADLLGSASTGAVKVPSGTTAQAPSATGNYGIRYNSDNARFEGANGTTWTALGGGGGGLVVSAKTHATIDDATLASGFHYIVDMSGATTDVTATLPAATEGDNLRISVVPASSLYKLTISPTGDTFTYGGQTGLTAIDIPAGAETWVELCATSSSNWSVEDATTPISGTFSGDLRLTGLFTHDLKGQTSQVIKTNNFSTNSDGTFVDITDLTATITPRSVNSKFKITVVFSTYVTGSGPIAGVVGIRNGSNTVLHKTRTTPTSGTVTYVFEPITLVYLDSPTTTSAVTYKASMYHISASGSSAIAVNQDSQYSSILVEEII